MALPKIKAETQTARPKMGRWVVPAFIAAALVPVPWIVFLVSSLPSETATARWDVAWIGFDVGLAVVLLTVALAAWRRPSWLEGAATAAAALLIVDAWFDVLTSSGGFELALAIGQALLVELPLAAVCVLLARNVERGLRGNG
jgi:hypothetical protein